MIESIVLVKWDKGWVAHLRYSDSRKDINISHNYKSHLYGLVEAHVEKNK